MYFTLFSLWKINIKLFNSSCMHYLPHNKYGPYSNLLPTGRTLLLSSSGELLPVFPLLYFLQLSIQLFRLSASLEVPVLRLEIEGLGTELKVRTFDMTSYTFLREICLECSEYMGTSSQTRWSWWPFSGSSICQVESSICPFFCVCILKMEKTRRFTSSPLWITPRTICSRWSTLR